jgi:hypothetical protein
LFPEELETRLRGLRNKAETAIEETGANICYIAFGFLEWFESQSSQTVRLAPLLLIPVRLVKGRLDSASRTYRYTLSYTGEDIIPNLSLREKLRNDFGLALPDLDEDTLPEDYFGAIERMIARPHQPDSRWRVRRQVTLALFNFSKLLMYLDLDPTQWPENGAITRHPIVSRFFTSQTGEARSNSYGFSAEHPIDDLPRAHEHYPLIDDADSSQHSVLVDVIEGEDLVVHGPPGTGKSQTITNVLAAALAKDKSILFVSEKLAALEVVKRRMDQAGLGDFCLELHSHNTQKHRVLADLKRRLETRGQYRDPEQIEADIAHYESLKSALRHHAERINSRWKNTGKSLHDILMMAGAGSTSSSPVPRNGCRSLRPCVRTTSWFRPNRNAVSRRSGISWPSPRLAICIGRTRPGESRTATSRSPSRTHCARPVSSASRKSGSRGSSSISRCAIPVIRAVI